MLVRPMRLSLLAFAATLVSAVACGAAPPPPVPAAPAQVPAAPAPAAAAVPTVWRDDMPKDDQAAFMKARVAPRMAKVFQAQNADRYAKFNCKTCHGPEYKEPKDYLPKLTMKDGKLTTDKPDVAKFMAEKVVPEMAGALGVQPFDEKTHQGFGCMGCHTVEMK